MLSRMRTSFPLISHPLLHFVHGRHRLLDHPTLHRALTLCQLSGGCQRTSVRPPDDIEKSVHRLHCTMPLSRNFAIRAPRILVKLAFSLRHHFFSMGGSVISYPENMENSTRKLSEERWRLSNGNPHHRRHVKVAVLMLPAYLSSLLKQNSSHTRQKP